MWIKSKNKFVLEEFSLSLLNIDWVDRKGSKRDSRLIYEKAARLGMRFIFNFVTYFSAKLINDSTSSIAEKKIYEINLNSLAGHELHIFLSRWTRQSYLSFTSPPRI